MIEQLIERAKSPAVTLKVLTESGVIRPHSPVALGGVVLALKQYGMGVAGGFKAVALRFPDRIGIVDELGELTFGEIESRSNALAESLSHLGVGEGDGVAILVRNHRGFLDASLAAAKLGADMLYLNTAFAAPQLGEVCERERPTVVIHDQEFTELIDKAGVKQQRILAWVDDDPGDLPTLEFLIEKGSRRPRRPPSRQAHAVILTSGTTGTPKGAPRGGGNLSAAVALLSRMPLRSGWRTHIAAPLFHTWGWAHLSLSMLLGSTTVLTRKFDPETCLKTVQQNRCESLVVIPVMLQRIMRLPQKTLDSYDLSSLKVVAASGSELPGNLATDWMDQFGDNLYNIYGSTEVAWVSIAQPRDMREAPGTAGKPPVNTVVKLYDADGKEVPAGEPGRIFVGNSMLFEGYTGGGHKESIDGLMSSGDVGRFDDKGRLFVEGRDDEMIVSGGENVFPKEVEDVLSRHEAVHEVAAIGVDDEEFGKRLRAFVVLTDKGSTDEDTLKAHVKDNLARYKVPREIVFLDELPRNATGKVLKRELAEQDEDGAGGDDA
jgi:acyl-CoA synthetase (AMP-forming)/AMP-acid ligase II